MALVAHIDCVARDRTTGQTEQSVSDAWTGWPQLLLPHPGLPHRQLEQLPVLLPLLAAGHSESSKPAQRLRSEQLGGLPPAPQQLGALLPLAPTDWRR